MLSFPRLIVIATVTACAVIVSGIGTIGYERYATVQSEAQTSMQLAISEGHDQLSLDTKQQDAVDLALANAEQLLTDSAGKTLDEAARESLKTAVSAARAAMLQQGQRSKQFAVTLARAEQKSIGAVPWPPDQLAAAKALNDQAAADVGTLTRVVASIGKSIKAVQVAQASWQVEQDRLAAVAAAEAKAAAEKAAAEEAARLAAPRNIPPVSTITESGGSTAPSAPVAPSVAVAPVEGFDIEAYVLALAPNSYISWVDALCDGYYVCGRAWVGGVKSTPVKIELDPALKDIYGNRIGISVLVHESAHARQWLYYGSDIISANEALTGLSGAPAVEYMADCATIGKLGYSTGTYTSSCTADQLDAAAKIW
ncbi:MAG: hypothetical protein JJE28_01175 [Actinomycetales bacterium]|nr:hypothetical protein [Actinomycetales bacterium]